MVRDIAAPRLELKMVALIASGAAGKVTPLGAMHVLPARTIGQVFYGAHCLRSAYYI